MNQLWKKFCAETTMHGFHEVNSSKTPLLTSFWVLTLVCATSMTIYQIYTTIDYFNSNPTKTEISTLDDERPIRYPPLLIHMLHFTSWLNLTKAYRYGFDVDTLLYTMSFYQITATLREINVTNAFQNLLKIMKKQNISNLYELAMVLSIPAPISVVSEQKWMRFLSPEGYMSYMAYGSGEMKTETVVFECFYKFNTTQFHYDSVKLFNYSFIGEYIIYNGLIRGEESARKHSQSYMPFIFNGAGEPETRNMIDCMLANYEFILKPTLFSWLSSKKKPCIEDLESDFYTECMLKCSMEYEYLDKLNNSVKEFEKCQLYKLKGVILDRLPCIFENTLYNVKQQNVTFEQYSKCLHNCTTFGCKQWKHDFNQLTYPREVVETREFSYVRGWVMLTNGKKSGVLVISQVSSTTWTDAIANVGGLIGLWLGGSILSFIQTLYIFCCYPLELRWENYLLKKTVKMFTLDNKNAELGRQSPTSKTIPQRQVKRERKY